MKASGEYCVLVFFDWQDAFELLIVACFEAQAHFWTLDAQSTLVEYEFQRSNANPGAIVARRKLSLPLASLSISPEANVFNCIRPLRVASCLWLVLERRTVIVVSVAAIDLTVTGHFQLEKPAALALVQGYPDSICIADETGACFSVPLDTLRPPTDANFVGSLGSNVSSICQISENLLVAIVSGAGRHHDAILALESPSLIPLSFDLTRHQIRAAAALPFLDILQKSRPSVFILTDHDVFALTFDFASIFQLED